MWQSRLETPHAVQGQELESQSIRGRSVPALAAAGRTVARCRRNRLTVASRSPTLHARRSASITAPRRAASRSAAPRSAWGHHRGYRKIADLSGTPVSPIKLSFRYDSRRLHHYLPPVRLRRLSLASLTRCAHGIGRLADLLPARSRCCLRTRRKSLRIQWLARRACLGGDSGQLHEGREISESASAVGRAAELWTAKSPRATMPTRRFSRSMTGRRRT